MPAKKKKCFKWDCGVYKTWWPNSQTEHLNELPEEKSGSAVYHSVSKGPNASQKKARQVFMCVSNALAWKFTT